MRKTRTQKEFNQYMGNKRQGKKQSSNMIQVNKRTYHDRVNEYMRKWFLHIFLPQWLPIIGMVLVVVYLLVSLTG